MKKIISLLLAATLLLNVFAMSGAALVNNASSLSSVPEGYTAITTAAELNAVRNNLSGKYILMNDIDLSDFGNWTPIGSLSAPFTGILDGNGYSIENLTQVYNLDNIEDFEDAGGLGLFGFSQQASFTNISSENMNISIDCPYNISVTFGGITSISFLSSITDCRVSGSVSIHVGLDVCVGGIVGFTPQNVDDTTVISDCLSELNITVIGENKSLIIFDYSQTTRVGGIVGRIESNYGVMRCENRGDIRVTSINEASVGGIAGNSEKTLISDCANAGNISAMENEAFVYVGGISGRANQICNCLTTTQITTNADSISTMVGAVAARFDVTDEYSLLNCYFPSGMAQSTEGIKCKNVKSLTEKQINDRSSFAGFDFEYTWMMSDELKRPTLMFDKYDRIIRATVKMGKTVAVEGVNGENVEAWASEDESIAVVDESGCVKGVKNGKTAIDIVLTDGQTVRCNVTVKFSLWQWIVNLFLRIWR